MEVLLCDRIGKMFYCPTYKVCGVDDKYRLLKYKERLAILTFVLDLLLEFILRQCMSYKLNLGLFLIIVNMF